MTAVSGQLRPTSTGTTDEQRLAAVTAPVRDPLWFLARQVQTKGFLADDGGSPVTVGITRATAPLVIDGRQVGGPVEPDLEAEPPTPRNLVDTATRIRLSTELLRRVADAGVPASNAATTRFSRASSASSASRSLAGLAFFSPASTFGTRLETISRSA